MKKLQLGKGPAALQWYDFELLWFSSCELLRNDMWSYTILDGDNDIPGSKMP